MLAGSLVSDIIAGVRFMRDFDLAAEVQGCPAKGRHAFESSVLIGVGAVRFVHDEGDLSLRLALETARIEVDVFREEGHFKGFELACSRSEPLHESECAIPASSERIQLRFLFDVAEHCRDLHIRIAILLHRGMKVSNDGHTVGIRRSGAGAGECLDGALLLQLYLFDGGCLRLGQFFRVVNSEELGLRISDWCLLFRDVGCV